MDEWLLFNKFFIIIFMCFKFSQQKLNGYEVSFIISNYPSSNTILFFLSILIYTCITMFMCIIKKRKLENICKAICIGLIILSSIYIDIFFLLLLPICICEMLGHKLKAPIISSLFLISIVIMILAKCRIAEYYFIFGSFSITLYYILLKYIGKVNNLMKIEEELKEKNWRLINDLDKDTQYENQVVYTSQLEVRNKIAQEIHDKVGHTLSASIMQLEASKLIFEKDPEKAKSIIENVINVLKDGMESIRSTLRNVKPSQDQMGISKLKLLSDEFAKNSGIISIVTFDKNIDQINFRQWKVIYENTKEALTNIIKYSKATNVIIDVKVLNKFVRVEVKDNGIGNLKIKKGLGLTGMEERTQGIGGKLIIDGTNGFSVIMLIPMGD